MNIITHNKFNKKPNMDSYKPKFKGNKHLYLEKLAVQHTTSRQKARLIPGPHQKPQQLQSSKTPALHILWIYMAGVFGDWSCWGFWCGPGTSLRLLPATPVAPYSREYVGLVFLAGPPCVAWYDWRASEDSALRTGSGDRGRCRKRPSVVLLP